MKIKKAAVTIMLGLNLFLLSGCGEEQKLYDQAVQHLENGEYQQALDMYNSLLEDDAKISEANRGAGIANLRMGNYEDAIEYFSSALSASKTSKALKKDILKYRATARLKAGKYEEAMLDCEELEQEYELDEESYFLKGCAALELDSYEEAYNCFTSCSEKDQSFERALQIYGVYSEKNQEGEGVGFLTGALQNNEKKTADDFCECGRIYFYMEDYDAALSHLDTAVEKGSTEAYVLQGMIYFEQGNLEQARECYLKYIEHTENASKGYNGLAVCDIKEENYDAALSNIETGLPFADGEELQSLLYNEIIVYEKKLDFSTAYNKALEYLELYPGDKTVEKEKVFLASRINNS